MTDQQMPEIGEVAVAYAEAGIPVFPCRTGDKRPCVEGGFHAASNDPIQVRAWWSRWRWANIGIPTEGFLIVDVDCPNHSWPATVEQRQELEATAFAVARTPRGGTHYWFAQPDDGNEYRNKVHTPAVNVDVRADGGYVVVPPSEVGGKAYEWVKSILHTTSLEIQPPPQWYLDAMDEQADDGGMFDDVSEGEWTSPLMNGAYGGVSTNGAATATPPRNGAVQARNVIPKGIRHDALIRLAASVRRNGFERREIEALLLEANRHRCQPPLPTKEVEAIAKWASEQEADLTWERVLNMSWHASGKPLEKMSERPEVEAPRVKKEQPSDTSGVPAELLDVPGFVRDVMQLTLDTAPYPNRALAFAGALALQAHICGRKVRDSGDSRPNLYLLALADSGTGKEWPRKVNAAVLGSVGYEKTLASTMVSTGGIEDALQLTPAMLYQTDEIDTLLGAINKDRDGRYTSLMGTLLTLYGGSSSLYVPRKKSGGGDKPSVDQPHVTLFGTAIPRNYYRNLSDEMGWNGFLSRTLIVEAEARGRGRKARAIEVPDAVRDVARYWCELRPGGGNLEAWRPRPIEVPTTPAGAAHLEAVRELGDDEHPRAKARDDQAGMTLWSRVAEQASRLALVYACSANHEHPVIDEAAAEWAADFAVAVIRQMLGQIEHYGSGSTDEDEMSKVMRHIRSTKEGVISHSDLLRKMKIKSKRLHELVETLVAREEIEHVEIRETRQKRKGYRVYTERENDNGTA